MKVAEKAKTPAACMSLRAIPETATLIWGWTSFNAGASRVKLTSRV